MKALVILFVMTMIPAFAQAQAPVRIQRFRVEPPAAEVRTASTPVMVAGGVGAGAIGFFAFGYLGAAIANHAGSYDDLDALVGAMAGATLGESVMLPVGVHLVNRRRGNLLPAMLVSTGIGVGAMTLAFASDNAYVLPAALVGQLVSSILIEKATSE